MEVTFVVVLFGSCDDDGVEVFFSLRSSSSFLAVMRISVSWMVQLPLRYSLEEGGGGGGGGCAVVVTPWRRGRLWCWLGMIDGWGNAVVVGSDIVLIWHEDMVNELDFGFVVFVCVNFMVMVLCVCGGVMILLEWF